jgi:hypothetical protein
MLCRDRSSASATRMIGAPRSSAGARDGRGGEQRDGSLYPEDNPIRVIVWNRLLRVVVAAHPGTQVLDLYRKLCCARTVPGSDFGLSGPAGWSPPGSGPGSPSPRRRKQDRPIHIDHHEISVSHLSSQAEPDTRTERVPLSV